MKNVENKGKIIVCLLILFFHRGRQILDDFREAYYWLSQNTADDARVMSWWDYGYQVNIIVILFIKSKNLQYINL